ncbi:MAG: hypothetical protein ACI9D5_000894 [Candidatus Endobugula sp.]|jgi:hypothetical protein
MPRGELYLMLEMTDVAQNAFEDDLIEGLSQPQKTIPCHGFTMNAVQNFLTKYRSRIYCGI